MRDPTPSQTDIDSARNTMLNAQKALEEYEKIGGSSLSAEHTKLERAFSSATDAYLRLIDSSLR